MSAPADRSTPVLSDTGSERFRTLVFAGVLIALYAAIMAVKIALWRENVLFDDWSFYLTSFWNLNFHNLWMFSFAHYIQSGYPSYLNEHFAPLLIPLAALYQIVPQPEIFLLALHAAGPMLAGVFIFATARHLIGGGWLPVYLALAYVLCPGILWPTISMIYGFQTDSLLAPCAAAAAWAIATRRTWPFFAALTAGLMLKENVPAYGVILGVCLILFTRWRVQGLAAILLSVAMFVIASKGVPWVTGVENRNVDTAWRFIDGLVHLRLTSDYTLPEVAIGIAYSLAFLPALAVWPFLGTIVPDLMLFSQVPQAKLFTWHVFLPITVLAAASVFGVARLLLDRSPGPAFDRRTGRAILLQRYALVVVIVSLVAGPATIWFAYNRYSSLGSPVDRAAVTRALALVPSTAGVVTTSDLEQFFARRHAVTSLPRIFQKAPAAFSYLVVNRNVLTPARRDGLIAHTYEQDRCLIDAADALVGGGAVPAVDQGGILVIKFAHAPNLAC